MKKRVKLTNTQLNKLKPAAKDQKEVILRPNIKNFENEELPYVLFVTARQSIKICNTIANITSTDMKRSKGQISNSLKEV